jgi:hypothetical protein
MDRVHPMAVTNAADLLILLISNIDNAKSSQPSPTPAL